MVLTATPPIQEWKVAKMNTPILIAQIKTGGAAVNLILIYFQRQVIHN